MKKGTEIPTIDVVLVTFTPTDGGEEYAIETASKVAVEVQEETTEAVKLVVKGRLIAQKPEDVTITGNQITLTDNVFTPELAQILQGGTIQYDSTDPTLIIGYTAPIAGTTDKGEPFQLNCYSAQYNAAGQIVRYEKISYPNCTGRPIALETEDGVFRVPEYVINSAPDAGEAPYTISYITSLPTVS